MGCGEAATSRTDLCLVKGVSAQLLAGQAHFLRPDSCREGDVITDAMTDLVLEGGLAKVTMRGLARRLRMNPGIVHQWFGTREDMLAEVGRTFGGRWYRWVAATTRAEGPGGLLPPLPAPEGESVPSPFGDEVDPHVDAMMGMRMWLALHELARSEPSLAATLAELAPDERQLVAEAAERSGHAWTDRRTDLLLATAAGLRHALAAGPDPRSPSLTLPRAHETLAAQVALLSA